MAVNSIVNVYPARGEFEDVEWEMGHPCAKLVTSIVEGQQSPNQPRVDMSETVWFALDKGEVIKIVRDQTYDSATVGGAPAGGGGPSKRGGPTKSAPPPRGGGNRGRGGKFGGGGGGINLNTPESSTPLMQNGKRGGFAGTGAGKAVQRSQNGRFTGGRTPTGGGRPTGAPSFGRLSIERIFILDM